MNDLPPGWILGAAVAGVLSIAIVLILWQRRRKSLESLLHRIAWERLADVVIPDDVDGEIHLDLALLTPRGILVLDVRHVSGTLFWGDQLESWTVLDGARRTVLHNPLPGLRARRHAVSALAPGVPVDGRILLVGDIRIAGDRPPGVVVPEDLVTEYPARGRQARPIVLSEAWAALKTAARPL